MSEVQKLNLDGSSQFADLILGIDLGTTNSAVAVYGQGTVPTLCPMNDGGKYTMPSCVRWNADGTFTVGDDAYQERYKENVVYSVKRSMGSGEAIVLHGEQGTMTMTPAAVSAEILRALKEKAQQSYPGVTRCIITVPAYFNQRQIEDTLDAARISGLDCLQILKEPTSASYIYSLLGYAHDGNVLVYDLGGGTFDVTHLTFVRKSAVPKTLLTSIKRQYGIDSSINQSGDDSPYYCRVLGTYGDTRLGGDDIDREMAKLCAHASGADDLTEGEMEELILKCERFKKNGYMGLDTEVGGHAIKLTDANLQKAINSVFQKTMALLNQIPAEELKEVSTIVLVGGSTKSNYLVSLLEQAFPGKEISRVLDPDATVALGAGAVAKDLEKGKALMYQDVLPMPIGILVEETEVEVCIPKNTAMPYSVTRQFRTLYDNQTAISVDVFQGVSPKPEECTYLGRLRLTDLPLAPAGEVKVSVSFILNAQGRLKIVSSIDGTEKAEELVIDSIFNVNHGDGGVAIPATPDGTDEEGFDYDDFEQGIADLIVDNFPAQTLVYERRAALIAGDQGKAADIEERIMGLL